MVLFTWKMRIQSLNKRKDYCLVLGLALTTLLYTKNDNGKSGKDVLKYVQTLYSIPFRIKEDASCIWAIKKAPDKVPK